MDSEHIVTVCQVQNWGPSPSFEAWNHLYTLSYSRAHEDMTLGFKYKMIRHTSSGFCLWSNLETFLFNLPSTHSACGIVPHAIKKPSRSRYRTYLSLNSDLNPSSNTMQPVFCPAQLQVFTSAAKPKWRRRRRRAERLINFNSKSSEKDRKISVAQKKINTILKQRHKWGWWYKTICSGNVETTAGELHWYPLSEMQ